MKNFGVYNGLCALNSSNFFNMINEEMVFIMYMYYIYYCLSKYIFMKSLYTYFFT
jgi:hypothetical protein